jgi:hypothetical protein
VHVLVLGSDDRRDEGVGELKRHPGGALGDAEPDGSRVALRDSAGRRRPTSASGQARAKPHLDTLHATLDVAKAKLHEIAETTDDTWDEVKQGADHVGSDVKASVEGGAYDSLEKPRKEG